MLTVDLYGQCADYDAVLDCCARFEVPVIEDAAEAMGATYRDRAAGSFGRLVRDRSAGSLGIARRAR